MVHSHILDISGQRLLEFTVYYKRFVFSDFNKTSDLLKDAYAEVNLKLWANNPDTDVNIYLSLTTHHGAESIFGQLERARRNGDLNNVADVEQRLYGFNEEDVLFLKEVRINSDLEEYPIFF
jgi:hypothetical protein